MEKVPIVRMQKGIRYKPKIREPINKPLPKPALRATLRPMPKPVHRTTLRATPKPSIGPSLRATPKPSIRPRKTMKRIPSPNPWTDLNMNSANLLYDPANPSPKVKLDSSKLFQKMKELQEMLKGLKQTRQRNVSMNTSAKAYLNRASYEDPLLENSLKLTGIKGTPLR
jgi:hypothetical protein